MSNKYTIIITHFKIDGNGQSFDSLDEIIAGPRFGDIAVILNEYFINTTFGDDRFGSSFAIISEQTDRYTFDAGTNTFYVYANTETMSDDDIKKVIKRLKKTMPIFGIIRGTRAVWATEIHRWF